MVYHKIIAICLLATSLMIAYFSTLSFLSMRNADLYYPSQYKLETKQLSDYFFKIKNSNGDTPVYLFSGDEPGGVLLILGGTHPDEPASHLAAVCLLENITVTKGKIIIMPRANNSGFTHSDPQEGNPQRFKLSTKSGERWFRYGSRVTNPIDQWPDPEVYQHFPSGQKLSGGETRNLNRAYPGRADGSLTEQIAFAIMQLMKQENVSLAIDLHEASPEYPVVNAVVAHPLAYELAAEAVVNLQMEGIDISLEQSPENLRGLSHREWGDYLQIPAVLLETASTMHGRYHGKKTAEKIITGQDDFYHEAAQQHLLKVDYPEDGLPLNQRVARHLFSLQKMIEIWNSYHPDHAIVVQHIPAYSEMVEKGIGAFLK